MTRINRYLLILVFTLLYSPFAWGDHCPEERRAVGKPETTIAGITFGRGDFLKVLELYGQADSKREYTDATYPEGSGEAEYFWEIDIGQLEVWTMFYHKQNKLIESVVSVYIKGSADIPTWQTGRGLRLGESFDRVIQLYGPKFFQRYDNELKEIIFCFSNETRLGVKLNENDKIIEIWLFPSIE